MNKEKICECKSFEECYENKCICSCHTSNKKPVVRLWSEMGLIVPMKTGVMFSNQVDGVACQHPELEGIFVPLSKEVYGNLEDIEGEYPKPDKIKRWISKHKLPLKLLESEWWTGLGEYSHHPEAWVNVFILNNKDVRLKDFIGKKAILTYPNSD